MNIFAKTLTGAAVAALALTAAAPAQAQYYPYNNGTSTADIIRGVAVAGAAAAAVGAITNAVRGGINGGYGYPTGGYGYPQGGYGYPAGGYGYPNGGYGYPAGTYGYPAGGNVAYGYAGQQYAVNACVQQAQRLGAAQVTDVDAKSNRTYKVKGYINGSYNGGYGSYGYNQRMSFKCTAREDGRITDFDTNRA